ncbi:DUF6786 family protein [Snuella lapsa]|uniref:Glycosyl hydrolase family 32 N-terminal domain-containing protein n=1 Tax=Snuella lapsa TaxID=870481 RepID=A0ABP6WRT0_9FLAO
MKKQFAILLLGSLIFFSCKNNKPEQVTENNTDAPVVYGYTNIKGIGYEAGITRRDPSDVIKVDDTYYVYYTKVLGQAPGYWGTIWYATSNDEGYTWQEQGEALGVGIQGHFDSHAVFTPNIMMAHGKYYLFYTGVKPTPERNDGVFENNAATDITALGLAIADAPEGPFTRVDANPVLKISDTPEDFDSYRIDDAALIYREGQYLLYYKGRSRSHGSAGPAHTQMGVAVSDQPEGPYVKRPNNPILDKSHEVMIWKQGLGVAALASISSTIAYSETGFDFMSNAHSVKAINRPNAPGAYRPDLTGNESNALEWGISMVHNGNDCYLRRFEVTIKSEEKAPLKGSYGYDRKLLQQYYQDATVMENPLEKSGIVVVPELQGRVMTSTLDGDEGMSFGWINHDLIVSGKINSQFNAFGGEERFWLGPEGGQFSLFFPKGKGFDFSDWKVPAAIDSEPFQTVSRNKTSVVFNKKASLTNYSGTTFDINIKRTVNLLSKDAITSHLGLDNNAFSVVAYETLNEVKNTGNFDWTENTGTVSIWLLCMLNPSPKVTVVAPIRGGEVSKLGTRVNDNYFGKISEERLKTTNDAVFFKADGKSRGKIGISPKRATKYIGSYDAENGILTVLEIAQPQVDDKYVNSAWEIQEDPFSGDVFNSYNDGPLENGGQLGPFYELESSSPALFLKAGAHFEHVQRIYHFKGNQMVLNGISKKLLSVSLEAIANALL